MSVENIVLFQNTYTLHGSPFGMGEKTTSLIPPLFHSKQSLFHSARNFALSKKRSGPNVIKLQQVQ